MNKFFHGLIVLCCLITLTGCGKRDETVSVNKNGVLYEIGEDVSFYYPQDFELVSKAEDSSENMVSFKKTNQVFFYLAQDDETDNEVGEKSELYRGELEEKGAKITEVKEPVLESGLKCYEYIGRYPETGLKFIHLVYFDENEILTYGYEANEKEYNENIDEMIFYIESFSKSTGL